MIKKDLLINNEDLWNVIVPYSKTFKNGDKNVKTFLKGGQIQLF